MSKPRLLASLALVATVLLAIAIVLGWPWYRAVYRPLVAAPDGAASVYVAEGETLDGLIGRLGREGLLERPDDARRVARLMHMGPGTKAGHYRVRDGWTAREWLVPLRQGQQDPVRVTFTKFRTPEALAGHFAARLSCDSLALDSLLRSPEALARHGLTGQDRLWAFLANTYEVWWHTTPDAFLERMVRERERFWDADGRRDQAAALGLTPLQVSTLASIVMEEQAALPGEWRRIAGLYLNRVARPMRLESDPTIKYALGRFEAQRVTFPMIDACEDSPWNTYRQDGIPPGPICTVSPLAVDAVLNAEDHDYLFMCAKADFSGYHAFARTLREHNRNRALFIAEQNRRGIR